MKKSHFLRKKLMYLGYVILEKGVTMDPDKSAEHTKLPASTK